MNQYFKLVYDDNDIVVVDKEHGVHVIEDRYDKSIICLKSILASIYGRIFVVHRLDSGTGGLMVFAKNEKAHRMLSIQFEKGMVKKEYFAIVEGEFKYPVTCLLPISKVNYHGRYKINFKSGKSAQTSFFPEKILKDRTLVKAIPYTGRSHQIRVHLKALKHPLLQDFLYNRKIDDKRLSLQASSLSFVHPETGLEINFSVDLSDFMKNLLRS
jgi:RluA family pseudouridine synthase